MVPFAVPASVSTLSSSTITSSSSTLPVSSSCGVKLASREAYLPASDGGETTSIASRKFTPGRVEAATVVTQGELPGEPMVRSPGPSLPAATAVNIPAFAAASRAMSSGPLTVARELPTE